MFLSIVFGHYQHIFPLYFFLGAGYEIDSIKWKTGLSL